MPQTLIPNGEEKHHRSQRMFAVINGNAVFHPANSPLSHAQWFAQEGWISSDNDPAFETIVLGYTDDVNLVAYRGKNFVGDAIVKETLLKHLGAIAQGLTLDSNIKVYCSVQRGVIGEVWPPDQFLGFISELVT